MNIWNSIMKFFAFWNIVPITPLGIQVQKTPELKKKYDDFQSAIDDVKNGRIIPMNEETIKNMNFQKFPEPAKINSDAVWDDYHKFNKSGSGTHTTAQSGRVDPDNNELIRMHNEDENDDNSSSLLGAVIVGAEIASSLLSDNDDSGSSSSNDWSGDGGDFGGGGSGGDY